MRRLIDLCLLALGRMSDRRLFSPFHGLVRRFYLKPLPAAVRLLLILLSQRPDIEVAVRHSTKTGKGFNAFFSDLDLTIILTESFNLEDIRGIRESYLVLKRFFPMLGEIEIFSTAEWKVLRGLVENQGELIRVIFDLKKIRWMELKLESLEGPYHKYKIKRSIWRILKKYEDCIPRLTELKSTGNHQWLGEGFEQKFLDLLPANARDLTSQISVPDHFSVYTRELDITVADSSQRHGSLNLNRDVSLILLSLFPAHYDDDHKIIPVLIEFRKIAEFRPIRSALLKYELLYANAAPRVHEAARNSELSAWPNDLLSQLGEQAIELSLHRHSTAELECLQR
jgi:hypothetical protein